MKSVKKIVQHKPIGRPLGRVQDGVTGLRLSADLLSSIDAWRQGQSDTPSRSEAIRRLVIKGLGKSAP
jgi:hypothetical protein